MYGNAHSAAATQCRGVGAEAVFNGVLPRLQSRGRNRPILFAGPLRQGLYDCGSTVLQIKAPAAKPTAIRDQNARLGRLRHLYVGSQPEWTPGEGRRRMKGHRSEEHTSELQSLMSISYAVFCWKKKQTDKNIQERKQKC